MGLDRKCPLICLACVVSVCVGCALKRCVGVTWMCLRLDRPRLHVFGLHLARLSELLKKIINFDFWGLRLWG
jgi:hypothetical protein